ncbi:uncharacterized protein K460DRAFT_416511 [Cucurbitaria berberidis CBS 394.84]|uniref:CorA-like transporter domain-containing protein n=1 Tax=Cucurbitaria berberidis CBS 394.84 TaxID=1168544 RepID=A0A9P4GHF4_9PLEO|nr:uncharacterized protein K460DRAFT_416511 [Cucurbitaria berberidis CBS 394.84]KAF1845215.1 hypothetical protein K460DRAFT_416511 [Cucurbitaria berberidis CBS 394.84]
MATAEYVSRLFSGWQTYPYNISTSPFDADANRYNERLSKDGERLFLPQEAKSELGMLTLISYKVVPSPEENNALKRVKVSSPYQLALCLKQQSSTRVFAISQAYSWGQLLITEEFFRKLLTALEVHPCFLDVVHIFGERITAVEESFAACFTRLYPSLSSSQNSSYEISYNFKYVVRHGRSLPQDPFSVRQTGVYHKYCANSTTCTWILLQPPEILSERIAKALGCVEESRPTSQFRYHALIFLCLTENLRDYLNYLEDQFSTLMDRGFFSNVKRATREGVIDTNFDDIRSLQIMTDKLKRLVHLLELNKTVCQRLQTFFDRMKPTSLEETASFLCQYEMMMGNCMFQIETHALQLTTMVSRAEGVGSMIEHILDVRSAETTYEMNSAMHEISKQSAQENKLVRLLTSQSTQDTRSMKVIALITSVFLPATFVATLFGSNFFGFEDTKDGHSLAIASNVWIYVIVAFAVSAITMAMWYWWYSRRPTTLDQDDETKSNTRNVLA